jgi:hypothetical protein
MLWGELYFTFLVYNTHKFSKQHYIPYITLCQMYHKIKHISSPDINGMHSHNEQL